MTGKNVSDSDSDMEVTLTKAKSTTMLGNSSTPISGSVAKKKFTAVLFPAVRKEIAGLQPIEKRLCPMQGCDSSGHMGQYKKCVLHISVKIQIIDIHLVEPFDEWAIQQQAACPVNFIGHV